MLLFLSLLSILSLLLPSPLLLLGDRACHVSWHGELSLLALLVGLGGVSPSVEQGEEDEVHEVHAHAHVERGGVDVTLRVEAFQGRGWGGGRG